MNAEPWSAVSGEVPGRGYDARQLETAHRESTIAELERRIPGIVDRIAAALKAEAEAADVIERARHEILAVMGADAPIHALTAAKLKLGERDKNQR